MNAITGNSFSFLKFLATFFVPFRIIQLLSNGSHVHQLIMCNLREFYEIYMDHEMSSLNSFVFCELKYFGQT